MSALARQARHAGRNLRRTPGFTGSILLALAVGVGLGVPVLGIVHASLLRSSPYSDPLLREGSRATEWFPRWTSARETLVKIQDDRLTALLWVLLALTVLLFGIALVNIITLILARGAARRTEISLRAALGAVRRQIVALLLVEGMLLALVGGGLGLIAGAAGAHLLHNLWPNEAPPWKGNPVDGQVVSAVLGAFVLAILSAWLSPAGVTWRRDLRRFLTVGGRATSGRREVFVRNLLAVFQIAASLVLLLSAGMLLRAFAGQGSTQGLGFDPGDTLTLEIRLPVSSSDPTRASFLKEVTRRVGALPSVQSVSLATPGAWLGLGTTDRVRTVCLECSMGDMLKPINEGPARVHAVSPGFFHALQAPLLRGRELNPSDGGDSPRVAVISDTFAYRLFPNGEPLGKKVQVGGPEGDWYTVVGIVDDIRAQGIGSGGVPVPALYLSALQHLPLVAGLAVRTRGDPMRLATSVRGAILAIGPTARIADVMTMDTYLGRFRAPLRWFAIVLGVLAGTTVLLVISGLYGVMSYNVTRRTREIGIRMALGARIRDMIRMVFAQSIRLTAMGAVIGLTAASALLRLLQLLFYGIEPFDPLLFGGVALMLAVVAIFASLVPARRAARVDPQISLQAE